jgi:tRNA pseudouridine55 synthase
LLDKPAGMSSQGAVTAVKRAFNAEKAGHTGTLDPMATGLLLIGINSATKLLTFLVGEDKTYFATIRLGASTITDDKESEFFSVAEPARVTEISAAEIETAISKLRGQIQQVPSSVSAIKVDGQRAYAKVRSGDEVSLAARTVTISRFEILSEPKLIEDQGATFIDVDVVVDCSSGTYIRALARDLGVALGVGGHLTALRRTRIGAYSVDEAQSIEGLAPEKLKVLDISEAAKQQFHVRELNEQDVIDLRHGKRLKANDEGTLPFAGIDSAGNLVAMLTVSGKDVKSLVVFND